MLLGYQHLVRIQLLALGEKDLPTSASQILIPSSDFQHPTEAAGQRRNSRKLLGLVAGILAFGWACGDGTGPPAPVATVTISSTTGVEVVPGGTQQLTAVAKDAKGNSLTDRVVTWS